MLRSAQRADAAVIAEYMSGPGARHHPAGEGRGVELVLGIEVQRGVHRPHPCLGGRLRAMQQMQEMPADAVVVGLHLDAACRCWRSDTSTAASGRGRPSAGRRCRARPVSLWSSFSGSMQPSADTPVRITSIGWVAAGSASSTLPHRRRACRAGPAAWPCRPASWAAFGRCAVDQQVGDLLELALLGDVEDVVAAVMQVVAGAADGAQRGVAGPATPDRATDFFGLFGRVSDMSVTFLICAGGPASEDSGLALQQSRRPATRRSGGAARPPAARRDPAPPRGSARPPSW